MNKRTMNIISLISFAGLLLINILTTTNTIILDENIKFLANLFLALVILINGYLIVAEIKGKRKKNHE